MRANIPGKYGNKSMQELKSSNILITGGLGFIGSHLVEKLSSYSPRKIVCLDKVYHPKSYFNFQKLEGKATLANFDIRDFKRLFNILREYEINIVFHLAAQSIVDTAYKKPLETIETNIMGTANILEACRLKGDLKSIVVVSSDKAYGKTKDLPYTEGSALRGDHPYDVSKTATDLIAQTYFKTYDLPIAIARPGNTFGPGDLNFNRLIPGIFESIIKNEELLIRSDGKMIREYIYVKDVVEGCLKLAENTSDIKGEAFNFGSKNIFSVIDIVKKIEEILKIKVNYKILNITKNEIPEQYLDWTKAKEILGWEPKMSFEGGIKESFNWYKDFYFNNE